jgi:two-component system OmpR family sensor kinase
VRAIAAVARDVAQGDLAARVGDTVRGSEETSALASDLDHMIAQLSALFSSQRTFISHAAHELRSPLTAMRGEVQLALRRPRENEDYQRTLVEVLADVEALVQLAEDLLTLARIQAGVSPAAGVAAVDVVTDAVRMARGLAEARNVEIRTRPGNAADASVFVAGARGDVARALRNLIENAIAHSPEGGSIDVALEAQADRMAFVVTDRGSGVRAEDAPNLFEPFFRGGKTAGGEPGGAGLGLAIAREIARAWGGDVLHDPRHTPGARFSLELPRANGQSEPTAARGTELTAAGR